MSNYDVEMVKKFAELNREQIEKIEKQNPEIGGLIKQILQSIVEEEKPIKPNLSLGDDEPTWIKLEKPDDIKSVFINKDLIGKEVAVKRFLSTQKTKNLTLSETANMVLGMLTLGDFYKLSDTPEERKKYEAYYKDSLPTNEIPVKYQTDPKFDKVYPQNIIFTLDKNFKFDADLFTKFADLLEALNQAELDELSPLISNRLILEFLQTNGAQGFYYSKEQAWFKPIEATEESIVLEDQFGNKLPFLYDKLNKELSTSLVPAPKPKFAIGDKVVSESDPYLGTGEILTKEYIKNKLEYHYEVEFSNPPKVKRFSEADLKKYSARKSKTIKPKQPVNPNPTPAEIEISNMTQEQLRTLKTDLEETLTYLEEGDVEKNDLEIQLELVNLYLEN